MSDFEKLRSARHAKQKQKSYVSKNVEHTKPTQNSSQQVSSLKEDAEMVDATVSVQVKDRVLYGVWPSSQFEIRTGEHTRGRGVFSKKQYRPGDIIVSVRPNIFVLSIANLDKYCSTCASPAQTTSNGLRRCAGCKVIHYCSSECQTRDWSMHKPECTALQSWAKVAPSPETAVPSDAVRCLGRILWRTKKSGGQSVFSKEIDAMESHRKTLQPSTYELHTHLAHALVRYLGLSSPEEMATYGLTSIADLVDLISRFTTNAIALTTPTLTSIGACISPSSALLNHSCDPSAVIVFPRTSANPKLQEPLLHVVAIKPISPTEELLTAYIDTTLPREDRQKCLKETYNFDCACSLCESTSMVVDPREAVLCPTRKDPSRPVCNGLCEIPKEGITKSRCNACNSSIDPTMVEEIRDAVRVSCEGLEKAHNLQYKDPEHATRLASNLIGVLASVGLGPGAHPLLALSRLHSSILVDNLSDIGDAIAQNLLFQRDPILESNSMSGQQSYADHTEAQKGGTEEAQQKLDDAIRAALRTSVGLAAVLVIGHPLRGLALAELGKLLNVDEPVPRYLAGTSSTNEASWNGVYPPSGPSRLNLARDILIQARTELMVGFGSANEGGEVGKEVRECLARVEKELQVWGLGMQGAV